MKNIYIFASFSIGGTFSILKDVCGSRNVTGKIEIKIETTENLQRHEKVTLFSLCFFFWQSLRVLIWILLFSSPGDEDIFFFYTEVELKKCITLVTARNVIMFTNTITTKWLLNNNNVTNKRNVRAFIKKGTFSQKSTIVLKPWKMKHLRKIARNCIFAKDAIAQKKKTLNSGLKGWRSHFMEMNYLRFFIIPFVPVKVDFESAHERRIPRKSREKKLSEIQFICLVFICIRFVCFVPRLCILTLRKSLMSRHFFFFSLFFAQKSRN